MAKITYIEHDGTTHAIDAEEGQSVMEAAKQNGVPGIDADCGGSCACATCHVHVAPDWWERTGGPSETEKELLELADEADEHSRLSCQIKISAALDGLVVTLPVSQR